MYSLRDFQKCTSQLDTQAVHTKGISKIVTSQQINEVINPLPNYILIMSISKDVPPHSMIPKLFTRRGLAR